MVVSCSDDKCSYQEPHDHGVACGYNCEYCLLIKIDLELKEKN